MGVGSRGSWRGRCWQREGYRGGGVRPGGSVLEGANFLGKGFDLFAEWVDGRPVVLVNLIDHLDHDHILFAGGGSPKLLVMVYLVEKVLEVGAWGGVSQVSLINMWEARYRVASGPRKQRGALWHENWGQGGGAILSGGAPSTRGWWWWVGRFALSFATMTRAKGEDRGIHMVFV